jgi:hypothetical protein
MSCLLQLANACLKPAYAGTMQCLHAAPYQDAFLTYSRDADTSLCGLPCLCLQVEALRGEVARYQSRLAELENDFLSLDVVASTQVGGPTGHDQEADMHGCNCCQSENAAMCVLGAVWKGNLLPLQLLQVGDYDAEMRKAWFTAAAFKKR